MIHVPDAAAALPLHPLVELLEREFSGPALERILELEGGAVPVAVWEQALLGPAREFLGRPGKAFRARLVQAGWELAGGEGAPPLMLPLLVELLHAGSLIVDDIEDGSTHRRGAPALHQLYGLPLALNTGNWLYFAPMALLPRLELPAATELAITRRAVATLLRCHQGQALDLSVRVGDLAQSELPGVVAASTRLKTGVLMEFAALLGALAAGAPDEKAQALGRFGMGLGLGLQMLDDLSTLESSREGPKQHEDLRLGRPTWPWAWLAQELAPERFGPLAALAREVEHGRADASKLAAAMRAALGRRGREIAHGHLHDALTHLAAAVGPARGLMALSREIARMEESYG